MCKYVSIFYIQILVLASILILATMGHYLFWPVPIALAFGQITHLRTPHSLLRYILFLFYFIPHPKCYLYCSKPKEYKISAFRASCELFLIIDMH